MLRHSTAHVLAQAVLRLWPGAHYAIGPVIDDGFYYDFELPGGAHFSDDDLERIEATMREIVAEDQPFDRHEHTFDEGLALFADQPFKTEIIEAVAARRRRGRRGDADAGVVTSYRNTEAFTDLCRGPHVPSTSRLGHFKLQRVAGAYWRGDEHRPQLQRIYGTAFESACRPAPSTSSASRRPSGATTASSAQELDLFSFPEEIGPGLAVFHPKGGLHPQADRGLLARAAPRGGLPVRDAARTSPSASCSTSRATSSGSRRGCTPRWSSTRARSTTSSR